MSTEIDNYFDKLQPGQGVHRRFNELNNTHVLVSPHRTKRPWNGQVEDAIVDNLPIHDPKCHLCPGNTRMGGLVNPDYSSVYTFDNDFPALLEPSPGTQADPLDQQVYGRCRVISFHPRHDLTLSRMDVEDVVKVVSVWQEVYAEEGAAIRRTQETLGGKDEGCVQIFENRGAMMGCSAPHPHGQVWSTTYVPDEPHTELERFTQHHARHDSHMLLSYAQFELKTRERVVAYDEPSGWLAVVPFWASWPFEVLVLPSRRHIPSILQLDEEDKLGLARILKEVTMRYDNLFECPFPYTMGLHQSSLPPTNPDDNVAQVHLHFYPPLLRSASVRKFMVGFELMGECQRDLTPEQAAARLQAVSATHYTETSIRNGISGLI